MRPLFLGLLLTPPLIWAGAASADRLPSVIGTAPTSGAAVPQNFVIVVGAGLEGFQEYEPIVEVDGSAVELNVEITTLADRSRLGVLRRSELYPAGSEVAYEPESGAASQNAWWTVSDGSDEIPPPPPSVQDIAFGQAEEEVEPGGTAITKVRLDSRADWSTLDDWGFAALLLEAHFPDASQYELIDATILDVEELPAYTLPLVGELVHEGWFVDDDDDHTDVCARIGLMDIGGNVTYADERCEQVVVERPTLLCTCSNVGEISRLNIAGLLAAAVLWSLAHRRRIFPGRR